MSANRSQNLRWKLGLKNCLAIDSDGLSEGVLFRDEYISVSLLSQGERYIDVLVVENPDGVPWRATFLYGEPRVDNRRDMWERLRSLCGVQTGPWMVIGDFNEAMWQYDHFSETPRTERQMMDFREVLSHCDLHDLGFSGLPWTYNNNQAGNRNVRVRLDRGVANTDWMALYPGASILHLTSSRSDHKALLLSLQPEVQSPQSHVFWYEIMWEREEELGTIIQQAWQKRNPGSDLGALSASLQCVTKELKIWSKDKFGHVTNQLEQLRKDLEALECDDPIANRETILKTKCDLDELLYREEMMWLQRSRITWLKEGDRNTKYFHHQAQWRARKNYIRRLKKEDGSWCSNKEELQDMAVNYFEHLFTANDLVNPQEIIDLLVPSVTAQTNADLCKEYSDEEIGDALFQISPLKAPGPDGLPGWFFQRN